MNIPFNTTTLRLTPVNALLQLQHQANHYKNIVSPRKITSHLTSRERNRKKILSGCFESKFQKQKKQTIDRQNNRIIKEFHKIYKAKGILQKAEDQFLTLQQNSRPSILSSFKTKQKMEQIKKENDYLKKKIQNLKPIIGDKQQWRKHQIFTIDMINKLQNKSKSQSYNTNTIVRIALSSQKQKVNYLKLFKTFNLNKQECLHKEQNPSRQIKTDRQRRRKKNKLKKKQKQSLETLET